MVTVGALDRDARDPNSSERMMTRCSHRRGEGIRLEFATFKSAVPDHGICRRNLTQNYTH